MAGMSALADFGGTSLIALSVMAGAVAVVIRGMGKAHSYRAACRRYQKRRAALSPDNVRIDPLSPASPGNAASSLSSPEDFLAELGDHEV
jgi:hypothetical protein